MNCKRRKLKVKVVKKEKTIEAQKKDLVIKIPLLKDLEHSINETVIGQEETVKRLCTKVYEGLCFPELKNNILLIGKSGTGKTEIVRQLAKNINLPCIIEDATSYTENGYVGSSVEEMIYNIMLAANNNIALAQKGIIFIDEIDKKANQNKFDYSNVNKSGVLKELLKIIEGTQIKIENPNYYTNVEHEKPEINFDTSNIIFIMGGAFEGLDKIRDKRLKNKNHIGFSSAEEKHIISTNYMLTSFSKEDLIEYGIPLELVGRIGAIYETNNLETEDLTLILQKSKNSVFKKYEKILAETGIKLIYSPKIFEKIAQQANGSGLGARELNARVAYIFEKIMYECFNENLLTYKKCILEDDIMNDNTKYHWE